MNIYQFAFIVISAIAIGFGLSWLGLVNEMFCLGLIDTWRVVVFGIKPLVSEHDSTAYSFGMMVGAFTLLAALMILAMLLFTGACAAKEFYDFLGRLR